MTTELTKFYSPTSRTRPLRHQRIERHTRSTAKTDIQRSRTTAPTHEQHKVDQKTFITNQDLNPGCCRSSMSTIVPSFKSGISFQSAKDSLTSQCFSKIVFHSRLLVHLSISTISHSSKNRVCCSYCCKVLQRLCNFWDCFKIWCLASDCPSVVSGDTDRADKR